MPSGVYIRKIKCSEETKKKISSALKGIKRSQETRKKMSIKRMGKPPSNKGKKRFDNRGEKNNKWKGGISKINKTERKLFMETIEYKTWRKSVFERDNYTCQICGEQGGILNADHIKKYADYPELRIEVSNGRTLCRSCHQTTETYGSIERNEKGQFIQSKISN